MDQLISEPCKNYSIVTLDDILSIDEYDLNTDASTEQTQFSAILLSVKRNDEKSSAKEYFHIKSNVFIKYITKSPLYNGIF